MKNFLIKLNKIAFDTDLYLKKFLLNKKKYKSVLFAVNFSLFLKFDILLL